MQTRKKTAKKATKKTAKKTGAIPSKQRAKKSASSRKPQTGKEPQPSVDELKSTKVTEENLKALQKLQKQAQDGDADAVKALTEVLTNYSMWRQAKNEQVAVAKECKRRLEEDEGALGEAVEKPIQIGSTQETVEETQVKLRVVEQRWQELQETKLACKEQKKEAQKAVRNWASKLDRSIQESSQLTLGFS